MNDWIKKMNEMFEANEYTDDKRVTVDYCENAKCIFIKFRFGNFGTAYGTSLLQCADCC